MILTDYKALTFDCYGTLIDWESGMIAGISGLAEKAGITDRNTILEAHARHESAQQRQTPAMRYSELLAIVYKRLAEDWRLPVTWAQCERYGASVADWPAFPDSAEALAYLKQHFKLVILSNVDNASFAASNARLGVEFDAIYTAQDVGAYKPADANFQYMMGKLSGLGLASDDILHTAESLFHDHVPANRHGLATCWIYRRHDQDGFGATMDPGKKARIDFRFDSMADLAAAHKRETGRT